MILTVTLNPAMDRLLFVNGFEFNIANRITRRENCVGGKGTHVSVNLACLNEPSVATGIAMGPTGEQIIKSLEELGVSCDFVYLQDGESRTNYVLIDKDTSTLICEKGPAITPEILNMFLLHYEKLSSTADYAVISGDASNFAFDGGFTLQDNLIKTAHEKGVRIILDSAGESLKAGVKLKPYLIKPNAEELKELTGMPVTTDKEIAAAIDSLSDYKIEVIAVSIGSQGSIVKFGNCLYRAGIAEVEAQNTVGCGDAYLSGMLYGIKNGFDAQYTLKLAAACGGAEALNPLTAGFDKKTAMELTKNVEIRKMEF